MDRRFTAWFFGTGIVLSLFFAWELGAFRSLLWSLPRTEPETHELLFTGLIILLLALATALLDLRKRRGTCPVGARNASAIAGALGAFTLLCPVCLLLPASLFGLSLSIAIFTPYLPLLRVITVLLLSVSVVMLWPKKIQNS